MKEIKSLGQSKYLELVRNKIENIFLLKMEKPKYQTSL